MIWTDIRRHYPHQWLLVEALLAHSEAGKRQLDELAVVDAFPDGETALRGYLRLHRDAPSRELYVVHSDREELEITERTLGLDYLLRVGALIDLQSLDLRLPDLP
ncbi:MAG TPA: hypothetical protein VGH73_08845 [Thermoanaerobaculia bacterium]|jgi:hypothetical protein